MLFRSADPQDFRWHGEQTYCFIGDDNVIREHAIINRGIKSEGGTRIGDGCFIMADSHIGHDSHIIGHCVIGNGVSIAGDAEIGECSILSSGVIIHENSRVGDWVLIKGGCRITGNVPPYVIMAHNPASYFGVNAVILSRKGFSKDEIDDIAKAYRHVYQSNTSVFNALRRIQADVADGQVFGRKRRLCLSDLVLGKGKSKLETHILYGLRGRNTCACRTLPPARC